MYLYICKILYKLWHFLTIWTSCLGHSSQPVKTFPVSRHEDRGALYPECVTNYIAQNRHLNRKEGQAKEKNGKYTKSLKSQTMWKLKARESATCCQMQRKYDYK